MTGLIYDEVPGRVSLQYRADQVHPLITITRPEPEDFVAQLEWVNNYASLRFERNEEIRVQRTKFLPYFAMVGVLHPDRMPRTVELLRLLIGVTGTIHYRIKHALACRRPIEYSPQVQPMISTPGHGSLPSGHATEAFTAALALDALVRHARVSLHSGEEVAPTIPNFNPSDPFTVQLLRIAERIAINRQVAGVHFPVDSVAGMVLAQSVSEFHVARCFKGKPVPRMMDGRGFRGDFSYSDVLESNYKRLPAAPGQPGVIGSDDVIHVERHEMDIKPSLLLRHLWCQAVVECARVLGPGQGQP
ncbi:phosphatase PAP2 family protein [Bradyrhizobium sp. LHD-71]|uniref:phosphatase PAP2 family protein n=1 Tax=Bradyrhizobium sp. LHD-71 TaxID=3072141 RepID=UPI00280DE5E9|nr:phosphatase PAP2 family protein [Bradyrhizobium sp. LHD-71]MDQ8732844.1 phosphatase PAP2 family protein [Bradyrhizobium sp. LHD-71]